MKTKARTLRDPFRCVQCGNEGILQVIRGKPYCLKHAEMKLGIRDKNGYKPLYEEVKNEESVFGGK